MAERGDDKRGSKNSTKKRNDDDTFGSDDGHDDPELENLPEFEREMRINERRERRDKERRKQELEKEKELRANAMKGGQKNDLLVQLKNKRLHAKDKKERIAAEEERNRDDSDDESSESDGEISNRRGRKNRDDDEDYVADYEDKKSLRNRAEKKRKRSTSHERKSPEKSQTLTMEALEKIRLSRKHLALLCSHTIFETTVKGAFVRVNQSSATKSSATDYIIAQIVGVQTYPKYYPIDDKEKETNKILLLKHGQKERPMKMCFVSNGEFTGAEFTKWINRMQRENQKTITIDEIDEKLKEIEVGLNFRYSNDDIRKNIDQRIQEKIKKGEALTYHEIEILENRKIQKEREYWTEGSKDKEEKEEKERKQNMKLEIEKLDQSIKKAKSLLKEPKKKSSGRVDEEKKMALEMAEMFQEEEDDPDASKDDDDDDNGDLDIEKEDEEDKLNDERMMEEMKKRGLTS